MAEHRTLSIVPLNDKNFPTWKIQCKMALLKEDLWAIVNGSEEAPSTTDAAARKKFMCRKDKALAIIVMAIEPKLLYLIGDPQDPKVVFDKLVNTFQKKTWVNKFRLRRKLHSLKLNAGESFQQHLKVFVETCDELAVVGDPLQDANKVIYLLASLPESFDTIVTAMEAQDKVPEWDNVIEKLLHEEKKKSQAPLKDDCALVNNVKTKKQLKCHECGKVGHFKRDCRVFLKKINESKVVKANTADCAERPGSDSESEYCGLISSSFSAISLPNSSWIIDSGASRHMTNNSEHFSKSCELVKPIKIEVGDGRSVLATAIGTVNLNAKLSKNRVKMCRLINVLYVPKLAYNLLSVPQLTKEGKKTTFSEEKCDIFSNEGELLMVGCRLNELFHVEVESNSNLHSLSVQTSPSELWHKRFCHLNSCSIKSLIKGNLVDGLDLKNFENLDFCESCAHGKIHRLPFPKKSSRKCTAPLQLVHSDVCGKVSSQSLSGCSYFLTFVDDFSRYTWVYFLESKDEVYDKFREWKVLAENQTGQRLKVFRSDNGGEYKSNAFEHYLKSEGIIHETTIPHTPEQNGVSERMNRTLVEAARSMLHDAKLEKRFWAEAVSTAVYTRNRSPTSAVTGQTPHEALTGSKPSVKHLRTFGCIAYSHIQKENRRKFDSKATKCILLGYGSVSKGYRLYNLEKKTVFLSRDVLFNETERTSMEKEKDESQPSTVFYDIPDVEASSEETEEPEEPAHTRPQRLRRPPDRYGDWVFVSNELTDPETFEDALHSSEGELWKGAMKDEMDSMETNKVWDLVELPQGRKPLKCKWVYKKKFGADGKLIKHKARLVAKGFSQKYGLDYTETFSPVARFESVRTIMATAVQYDLQIHQLDVQTAFLNGELEEDVYMEQPQGFEIQGKENLVCHLRKSIYGLKQSPRCWNSALNSHLQHLGFVKSSSDPCVYTRVNGELFIIGIYVDDILLACNSLDEIERIKSSLLCRYKTSDLGQINYFLGIKITQNFKSGEIFLNQQAYTEKVLERFGLNNANSVKSPIDPCVKLEVASDDSNLVDVQKYQSAIGSLLYLSTKTRPDIAFAVNKLARFCSKPTDVHWLAVKRIMRYLKGTSAHGLLYSRNNSSECVGFSDADWAGDVNDRKSTTGYTFQIGGASVSWNSSKQSCVALSTAESEYIALSSAAQEAVWLQNLLSDLRNKPCEPITIFDDNQAALSIAKDSQCTKRTKHVDIKYHFIREKVLNSKLNVKHCSSSEMVADVLTKPLTPDKFIIARKMLGVVTLA